MQILDGKLVAETRRRKIQAAAAALTKKLGRAPGLAVILVGDDPASQVYVGGKIKACREVGLESFEHRLSSATTAQQLKAVIDGLNENRLVDGILLQLPLPKHLNSDEAIQWIAPEKDADCLTPENLGLLWSGRPRTLPCTPAGVMAIFDHYKIPIAGKNAVVVGRSQIVGKPMAHLMVQADATVTVCHSKTVDLHAHVRRADIAIIAAGKPKFLGKGDFAEGAVVIDVGVHRVPGSDGKSRLCGDVRLKELEDVISAATPVPGGVGPMTITMLLENTVRLASLRK